MDRHRPAVALVFLLTALASGCQPGWVARSSVEQTVATYPDRIDALLEALDLDYSGLEPVGEQATSGDRTAAAHALLNYYRTASTAGWLRSGSPVHDPGGYDTSIAEQAAEVLDDVYTFQGVKGQVRRLDDGSIDWHYQGPRDDFQWALFLNRHFIFVPLLKAYGETRDRLTAQYISEFVVDWVLSNPPEDISDEKQMSAAWRPMSAASRLLQSWPQAFFALQNDPGFTAEARLLMLASVPEQAYHLRWHHRPHHNHTVKEMAGLAHAALAWPEYEDADAWLEYAITILARELERQVYPDGVQKELSNHYQRTVLQYFRYVVEISRAGGRAAPDWFERRIEEMANYLARAMRPSGHCILNNDADLDFVRPIIAEAAELFDRDDWRFITSAGQQGMPPADGPSAYFPWAGHLISRSDWSERAHWSWFDVGPWGLSHQHDDSLHLSVSAFGRDILVDTGRYNYDATDPVRAWIQSSAAHNVILVDGAGQLPSIDVVDEPLPIVTEIGSDADYAVRTFDDGYEDVPGKVSHTRAVSFLRDQGVWVVLDHVETDRPRQLETLWHFHPACTVIADGGAVRTVDEDVGNLGVIPVGGVDWTVEMVEGRQAPDVQGWYSPTYGVLEPAPVAVYRGAINGPTTFAWILIAGDGAVPASAIEVLQAGSKSMRMRLEREGSAPAEIEIGLEGSFAYQPLDGESVLINATAFRQQ